MITSEICLYTGLLDKCCTNVQSEPHLRVKHFRIGRLVPSLKDQPYEKRLKDLGLYSLKDRRDRGDMISVFKIMNNLIDLDISKLFTLYNGPYNTRGHSMKLDQKRCHTDIKRFTFSQRIIGKWNTLPEYVIGSKTADTFKKNYDMYKKKKKKYKT